mgnify:CR=1 FL=1
MCTSIILFRKKNLWPVIIGTNRDERIDRESQFPGRHWKKKYPNVVGGKDLEKHENAPIQDILDLESGIKSRSIYGSNSSGSKSTLDIRGMGAQAKSNVLILINGQRLNNIDMSEIDFPSIPMESIDRIEIFKGNAASVLYGDGAIGGAINIITNPEISTKSANEIILKNGTFSSHEIIWNTSQKINHYS